MEMGLEVEYSSSSMVGVSLFRCFFGCSKKGPTFVSHLIAIPDQYHTLPNHPIPPNLSAASSSPSPSPSFSKSCIPPDAESRPRNRSHVSAAHRSCASSSAQATPPQRLIEGNDWTPSCCSPISQSNQRPQPPLAHPSHLLVHPSPAPDHLQTAARNTFGKSHPPSPPTSSSFISPCRLLLHSALQPVPLCRILDNLQLHLRIGSWIDITGGV
ncbi:hypothetical protein IAQ61_009948 [Plenodomus lingam]|uniref:uncharacterized protein n=1 Tax=Leptosphaeria maculans TaxID=5022 RepID=UPI00332A0227|nr:hypothetical protein IAQ61_009948 [Plenodomus lingam]